MLNKNLFSQRLKSLRLGINVSQETVAKACELGKSQISMLEAAKSNATADTLIALADYFNVPLDYLVGREVDSGSPLPAVTPDELALLEKLRALPPGKRKAFKALLD